MPGAGVACGTLTREVRALSAASRFSGPISQSRKALFANPRLSRERYGDTVQNLVFTGVKPEYSIKGRNADGRCPLTLGKTTTPHPVV